MRRRTLLAALTGLAVVVAAGVVVLWPWQSSRITRENYERIHERMSQANVEAILGPPGDYRTSCGETPVIIGDDTIWTSDGDLDDRLAKSTRKFGWIPKERGRFGIWMSDTFFADISIDATEQVTEIRGWPRRTKTQTAFDSFLWRINRQRHRWFP
jgi:hypothetical protein